MTNCEHMKQKIATILPCMSYDKLWEIHDLLFPHERYLCEECEKMHHGCIAEEPDGECPTAELMQMEYHGKQ